MSGGASSPVALDAAERGIRVAGLLEADRLAMTALADLAAAGKVVLTLS